MDPAIPLYKGKPVVGVFPELADDPVSALTRASKLGDVVQLDLPKIRVLLVNDPEKLDHVLTHHNVYTKETADYDSIRKVTRSGLISSGGPHWLRQRRIMQPAFARQNVRRFGEMMLRASNEMVDRWKPHFDSGKAFDLGDELAHVALVIVGETLLGGDLTRNFEAVNHALHDVLGKSAYRVTHPFLPPEWVPISFHREFKRSMQTLDALVEGVIAERHKAGAHPEGDLLDILMSAKDPETGESMTDVQLRDEVLTMFIAGHESSSNALAFAFYLLSRHPECERKLRAELASVLGGKPVSPEDVPKLTYTLAVLNEAMRLYPPAWALTRMVSQDDDCKGLPLKKGDVVMFSQYLMHRRASLYPNPEGFDPERWLQPDLKLPRSAYIPFLAGPRKCIGDTFALMEMPIILATVMQRARVELDSGFRMEIIGGVTLRPKNGLPVTVRAP
jgi:cytochrome P450